MGDSNVIKSDQPCDHCGSSDAKAYYDDNHSHCYSCGKTIQRDSLDADPSDVYEPTPTKGYSDFFGGTPEPIPTRGLHSDTCRKFSYHIGEDEFGNEVHIANFKDDDGNLIGQKIRGKDKKFTIKGNVTDRFFGQHLFVNGGRMLVCTEGELDALTVSQLGGNKYPTCSLPNGAGTAKNVFKKNFKMAREFREGCLDV